MSARDRDAHMQNALAWSLDKLTQKRPPDPIAYFASKLQTFHRITTNTRTAENFQCFVTHDEGVPAQGFAEIDVRFHLSNLANVQWSGDIELQSLSSTDGRWNEPVACSPGGDIGEFLSALAVFEFIRPDRLLTQDEVESSMVSFLETTKRQSFCYQTTRQAMENLANDLRGAVPKLDIQSPPPFIKDRLLRRLVVPDNIGSDFLRCRLDPFGTTSLPAGAPTAPPQSLPSTSVPPTLSQPLGPTQQQQQLSTPQTQRLLPQLLQQPQQQSPQQQQQQQQQQQAPTLGLAQQTSALGSSVPPLSATAASTAFSPAVPVVRPELVPMVITSFFNLWWRPSNRFRHKMRVDLVDGEHREGAIVHVRACAAPNGGTRTLLVAPRHSKTKHSLLFLNHVDAATMLRSELSVLFTDLFANFAGGLPAPSAAVQSNVRSTKAAGPGARDAASRVSGFPGAAESLSSTPARSRGVRGSDAASTAHDTPQSQQRRGARGAAPPPVSVQSSLESADALGISPARLPDGARVMRSGGLDSSDAQSTRSHMTASTSVVLNDLSPSLVVSEEVTPEQFLAHLESLAKRNLNDMLRRLGIQNLPVYTVTFAPV
eukprot:gnl/Spiro4/1410_TR756_c0_g1_i1.p1 gnl/Spiro4/1410_TR756_c0_g1~~gnl/Spiro4/1410_TR756_c0_g1_i1.p1  ORF type:complete len:609 (+),score=104.66 gnl/Spiro4/1410_TR756_c0_g1_i1:28-1827(+)